MIHINRNRETLGKFTEQEVADGLKSGRFLPTDLAWRDPMPAWQPLSTFDDLPEPTPEDGAIPVFQSGNDVDELSVEPSWERESGSFAKLTGSIRQILSTPTATFQKLPATGGYKRPLFFYTVAGWASGAIAMFYQTIGALINPTMFLGDFAKDASQFHILAGAIAVVVFLPIFLITGSFVSAGIYHFLLMLTGGARNGFEATYRALAYAGGAASVFQLVPLCGGYLYPIANLIYSVIALKEVHRTDLWRVILAAFLIFLICCGLVILAASGLVAMAGALESAKG